MNNELLSALEYLEKERGIKKEILIKAVESALISAVRKTLKEKTAEIRVEFDSGSGGFKFFADEKEIQDPLFGRIAAQTAKQVIIQRIREAEKDIAFEEFESKKGDIVNGLVHRFEKNAVILDLGKAEGILPKKEQLPKENYRQGERIKALVLEVNRGLRGLQIILSRNDASLVKRLFELEVPEISEGIVEIKSIARDAGERTKIAVFSKDEKIDSVGSCVGMRGSRVKDIVRELQGEKIDIIKWEKDIKDFVKNALSPAKVSEVAVDEKNRRIEVVVENDQLSLAIGKHGQNVRLASKLISYEIDIKSYSEITKDKDKEIEKEIEKEKEVHKVKSEAITLDNLAGVGEKTTVLLKEAGFDSIEKIAGSSVEELTKIKGLGEKTAEKIIAEAKKNIS
ncbi:MAG: transcription termination factor NusA [Candidatus Omnitrophota bacterium]